jgi:hypothetical protein
MERHDCCHYGCENPATIYIGENGNPDTEWICVEHYDRWHADRARFLADGGGCAMEEL